MARTTDPVITTVTPRDLPAMLEGLVLDDLAYFIIGQPGIGKTMIVNQTMSKLSLATIDIRAALLDTVDLRGVPYVEDRITSWARPDMFPLTGPYHVFFDELTRAAPVVQNSLFSVIYDKKVGEHRLPDGCSVGAAGNRESDGGGVYKMPAALADRFTFINLEIDNDDWTVWAINSGVIEPVVIAFLRLCPDLLSKFDPKERVSPTPRSWERASRIIKRGHPAHVQKALLAGTVGEEAAVKFQAFEPVYRQMPSVDAILLSPTTAAVPTPDQANLRVALASALAFRATDQNIGQVIAYLNRLPQEYAAFAMKDATTKTPAVAHTMEYIGWAAAHNIAA